MNSVRVRFAPSPTGDLHIGGLRTALFNYLFAKKNGGSFILRIEDTDRNRFVEGSTERLIDALRQYGVLPDEGPGFGGDFGPYIQSERLNLYTQAADKLIASGAAYHCFCTPTRLEELRASQAAQKLPPRYDGHCRNLSAEHVQELLSANMPGVVRLRMPEEGSVSVDDAIRGKVSFDYALLDDPVLLKSDGFPTYHLAVVVDDHAMQISHVFRAEEWLSSTPKHLFLYEKLGYPLPVFAHLPLILSPKGGKLSKRDGDVAALHYLEEGYLPEAVINFIAFLGWNPKTDQEIFTLEELTTAFSLEGIQKSGAIFDVQKLNHLNATYIRKLSPEELVARAGERVRFLQADFAKNLPQVVALSQDRLVTLNDIEKQLRFMAELPEYPAELLIPKKSNAARTLEALTAISEELNSLTDAQIESEGIEEHVKSFVAGKGFSNSEALWPLRVALSGQQHSPGVFEILRALGKPRAIERLNTAIAKLNHLAERG